jgi:hypothetical protein
MSKTGLITDCENLVLIRALMRTINRLIVCVKKLNTTENIKLEKEMFPNSKVNLVCTMLNTIKFIQILRKQAECFLEARPPRHKRNKATLMMKDGEELILILGRKYQRIKLFSAGQKAIAQREFAPVKTEDVRAH